MNGLSLAEAEAFLAVLDAGGFGAAARRLGVTQSTVSRRLAALEARLGRPLIARTTRRLAATEAGLTLAGELREIVARLAEAEARVQALAVEPRGLVRITMPSALGRAVILPALAGLAAAHQGLDFDLDLSDRYVDILAEGFDLAVRLAEPQQSGLAARQVAAARVVVCAAPGHLAARPLASVHDLAERRCLVQKTYAPRADWPLRLAGRPLELRLAPRMTVSDVAGLRELALAGAGIAALPVYLVRDDLARGTLVEAWPGLTLPPLPVWLATPAQRDAWGRTRLVADHLAARLADV